jgi:hypothetical protein
MSFSRLGTDPLGSLDFENSLAIPEKLVYRTLRFKIQTKRRYAMNVLAANEAMVNVTFSGQNGDLRDPVPVDSTEAQIRTWVTEAVRGGSVAGIPATQNADFGDYVVDRFAPTDDRPHNLIQVRPKTPFGG